MVDSEAFSEDDLSFSGPATFFANLSTLNTNNPFKSGVDKDDVLGSRDTDYWVPFMNHMVSSNHDRLPPSRLPEAFEVDRVKFEEELQLADMESKIEEAMIRRTGEEIYPDGPKSLFLCGKFALISQNFLKDENVLVLDEVYKTFERLLEVYIRKLVGHIAFIAQAKVTMTHGDKDPKRHQVDDEMVKAALSIMPFPGRKDFVSEDYAEAIYTVLNSDRSNLPTDSELEIETGNFFPYGSAELDSDYSTL